MKQQHFDADAFLRKFWEMDRALVKLGFPAISEWWKHQITRFVRAIATGARRWVIRAGRRAGKSTTLCRLAVAWSWFGTWHVPPGDTPVVPFISISKDESAGRLRTIAALLKALGLQCKESGEEIASERGVLFKVFAATTSAVVGFTSIAVFGDEVARWESRDERANPAREVIGSLSPTLATQAFGFIALCSSPWSQDDFHAELFSQGDSQQQVTSFAPTWEANPTISEEATHEMEQDQRTWSREYAAEPGATVTAAFDLLDVDACFGREDAPIWFHQHFAAIDPSSLRGDTFAAAYCGVTRESQLVVRTIRGWTGEEQRDVSIGTIVEAVSNDAKAIGAHTVFSDQREEASLSTLFARENCGFKSYAWTEASKDDAVQLLRRMMRERRVFLPEHEDLKRQLRSMKARLLPSGRIKYESSGLDYASTLITLGHAIVANDVAIERGSGDLGITPAPHIKNQARKVTSEILPPRRGSDEARLKMSITERQRALSGRPRRRSRVTDHW